MARNLDKLRHQPDAESRPTRPGTSTPANCPTTAGSPISFGMLLNLASVVNAETAGHAVGLHPPLRPRRRAGNRAAAGHAGGHADRLLPGLRAAREAIPRAQSPWSAARWKISRPPPALAWTTPRPRRSRTRCSRSGSAIRSPTFAAWFGCLYQVLLGQQEGPRFGGFVALYGIPETIALIRSALARRRMRPERWLRKSSRSERLTGWVRHLPGHPRRGASDRRRSTSSSGSSGTCG